jgi:hypothetical protein
VKKNKREFFWAVFSVTHEGCPLIGLSTKFNATVRPSFFDASMPTKKFPEAIDVCLEVDTYIEPSLFFDLSDPFMKNLNVLAFEPSMDENRTLIIGTMSDSTVKETFVQLERIPPMYARGAYEYITIRALMNYETWRKFLEKLEAKLSSLGEVALERLGKVRTVDEYRVLRIESLMIETPLACLSHEENMILSTALTYGYYEQPRRINLDELSRRMGIPKATLHQRLRKIEEKLLTRAAQRDAFSWRF